MPRKLDASVAKLIADGDVPADQIPLVKATGSPVMAAAILETDQGVYPSDPDAVSDFLVVNRKMEDAALKKWLNWKRNAGSEGKRLESEYQELRKRTMRLFNHLADGADGTNGQDS